MVSNKIQLQITTIALLSALAVPAWAQPARYGTGFSGQPGVARTLTGFASIPGSWTISALGTYGWQPDLLQEGDAVHETWARLALSYAPWRFLQISVSLDQTIALYDWPGDDSGGLVVGSLGDPRIALRTGWDLGAGFSLAFLVDVMFPSSTGAFAFVGSSISPSFDLAASFAPERVPIGVHVQLGYHHDRTSELAAAASGLTEEQLALSGVSSSMHHIALGLAVEYRFRLIAPFVELTGDFPLDDDKDGHNSLLVGLGARLWLGPEDAVQLSLAMEFRALAGNADPDPVGRMVWEIPPLINVMLGVTVRLPIRSGESATVDVEPEGVAPVDVAPRTQELGRIAGRVLCGTEPCGAGPLVEVVNSGASPYAVDVGDGTFVTAEIPPGAYRVVARMAGAEDQVQEIAVAPGARVEVTLTFPAQQDESTGIRGRVTDFNGAPVQAVIRIPSSDIEVQTDEQGQFHIDVPPGSYQVIVWSPAHQTQTIRLEVAPRGVVVMNAELRSRRRRR